MYGRVESPVLYVKVPVSTQHRPYRSRILQFYISETANGVFTLHPTNVDH